MPSFQSAFVPKKPPSCLYHSHNQQQQQQQPPPPLLTHPSAPSPVPATMLPSSFHTSSPQLPPMDKDGGVCLHISPRWKGWPESANNNNNIDNLAASSNDSSSGYHSYFETDTSTAAAAAAASASSSSLNLSGHIDSSSNSSNILADGEPPYSLHSSFKAGPGPATQSPPPPPYFWPGEEEEEDRQEATTSSMIVVANNNNNNSTINAAIGRRGKGGLGESKRWGKI